MKNQVFTASAAGCGNLPVITCFSKRSSSLIAVRVFSPSLLVGTKLGTGRRRLGLLGSGLMGHGNTNQRIDIISTARRWAEFLVAVLIGNIVYFSVEPQLPSVMHHRMYQIDLGLAVDFVMCVAAYGLVRLIRGFGGHSK